MGARYYDSGTGRFSQLDPLPDSRTTIDQYAYVGGNPVNFVDPTGLIDWLTVAGGVAAAVGVGCTIASAGTCAAVAGGVAAGVQIYQGFTS